MAIASVASIQSALDSSAQGRGIRITRSVRVSSTVESRYVVPVISSRGQAGWINTSVSSSAAAIASGMLAAMPNSGAAPRSPST